MEHLHKAFLRGFQQALEQLPPERVELFLADDARLGPVVGGTIDNLARTISVDLKEGRPDMLVRRRQETRDFEDQLIARWGIVVDALETLIVIALEAGSDFNGELRPQAFANGGYRLIVLTALHARSCQVAQEVLVLLRSGFGDGAHARWRCLHELAVVAFVLAQSPEELSQKYMLHQHVESYRAMLEYQSHAERLGQPPYSQEDMEAARHRRDEVIHRYGDRFGEPDGWAAALVPHKGPKLADLERCAKLDHLRPYYRMAAHNVHAGPRGASFRLGRQPGSEVLLAGPSVYGLADPADGTAISLYHCTVALLTIAPNVDRLVTLRIMSELVHEIRDEAMVVHSSMDRTK